MTILELQPNDEIANNKIISILWLSKNEGFFITKADRFYYLYKYFGKNCFVYNFNNKSIKSNFKKIATFSIKNTTLQDVQKKIFNL